ncbi:hypothetical protein CIK02_11735 [Pseudomonas putida]|nr:hypothetical protein CIK02_11735 [Pseudomonas putida]
MNGQDLAHLTALELARGSQPRAKCGRRVSVEVSSVGVPAPQRLQAAARTTQAWLDGRWQSPPAIQACDHC